MPVTDLADCLDIQFTDGVDEVFEEGDVALYPNPVSTNVQIVIDRHGVHTVSLMDLGGRTISSFETTAMVQNMNVSDLSSGIYLVEVRQGDQSTVVRLAID